MSGCPGVIAPDEPMFALPEPVDPLCAMLAEAEWILLIGQTNQIACGCYDEQTAQFGECIHAAANHFLEGIAYILAVYADCVSVEN